MARVVEGELKISYLEPHSEVMLRPDKPGLLCPQPLHLVTPLGLMKMQVDFYDQPPPGV